MTKTLADMTAEERAECVGMWCEVDGQLEILAAPDGMVDYHDTAILHSVKRNGGGYVLAKDVTPRFDLPRAWTPNGEPVPMKKELGFCGTAGLETTVHKYNSGTIYVSEDTPHGEVYRWVGEWEQDND